MRVMSLQRRKDSMEEEKKKSVASIPDNYVSILQLQERWMKEKERKHKQKDLPERGVKQQVDRRRDEENVMKVVKPSVKHEEEGLSGGFRMHCGVNRSKKEPNKVSAIVIKKDEDGGDLTEKKKNNPVKEDTFTSKGENAAKEEAQFRNRWIKKKVEEEEESRQVNGTARLNSGHGYSRNQRRDWSSTRVIKITTRTMVWVKKGKNDGAAGDYGNV